MRLVVLFSFCLNFSFGNKELIETVKTNNINKVKDFFENARKSGLKFNINEIFPRDSKVYRFETALSAAIDVRNGEIVEFLIEKNADVELEFLPRGANALTYAAYADKPAMVEVLVKNKADVNHKEITGESALMAAIFFGRLNMFEFLISSGSDYSSDVENYKKIYKWDPLQFVLYDGNREETVESVIARFEKSECVFVNCDDAPVIVHAERELEDDYGFVVLP